MTPGQRIVQLDDEPEAVLIYDGIPSWVRTPAPLGGHRVNVLHGEHRPCPCGRDHTVLVLVLDATHGPEGKGLRVAECGIKGFLWFAE